MPNPYGIEQVDVPGMINAYRLGQSDRIDMLTKNLHLRQMDATLNHQRAILAISQQLAGNLGAGNAGSRVVGAYGAPGPASAPDDPASAPDNAPASTMGGAYSAPALPGGAYGTSPPATAPASVSTLPPAPGGSLTAPTIAPRGPSGSWLATDPPSRVTANASLLGQLSVLDPAHADALLGAFGKMDKAGVDAVHSRNNAVALAADQLMRVPLAQRAQMLRDTIGPELARMGVPADVLDGAHADLSDAKLQFYVQQAREIEKVIDAHRADRNVDSEIQRRQDETAIGQERNRIDEGNNIRTNATSSANNIRSTGTSAANSQRSTAASRYNRDHTPAATVIAGSGNMATVYPDGHVVTMRDARPVSTARGRGRAGGGAPVAPEGTVAMGPGGHTIVKRNGQWLDVRTNQPIAMPGR